MSVSPYIFFSGTCAEAFTRYQEVLGGELQVMTHAELPEGAEPMPGAEPHHVMHASLTWPDGMLMGSDDPTGDSGAKVGVAVAFTAPDAGDGREAVRRALSEGGEVMMPLRGDVLVGGLRRLHRPLRRPVDGRHRAEA